MDGNRGEASLTSREVPLEGLPQLAQGAGEGAGDRALVDVKDGRNFLVAEAFGAKLEDLELTGGGDAGEPAADLVAALGGVEVRRFGCGGGVTDFVFGPGADLGLGARAGDVAAHGTVEPFAGLGDGDALAPESEQVQEGLLDGFLGLAAVGRTEGGEAQQAGRGGVVEGEKGRFQRVGFTGRRVAGGGRTEGRRWHFRLKKRYYHVPEEQKAPKNGVFRAIPLYKGRKHPV